MYAFAFHYNEGVMNVEKMDGIINNELYDWIDWL
jgi:hypothetical protein